ncbi:hypothetical protein TIFTF001_045401 [Ficus carica]|uniref:Uncharacterized protein n=1 Tax=Ficus carica TaxID=3494 RepID=A0AA88CL86_FICCA|nr:hypothetical protein TIFTF001_045401 [Ficus carica]
MLWCGGAGSMGWTELAARGLEESEMRLVEALVRLVGRGATRSGLLAVGEGWAWLVAGRKGLVGGDLIRAVEVLAMALVRCVGTGCWLGGSLGDRQKWEVDGAREEREALLVAIPQHSYTDCPPVSAQLCL